MSILNSGKGGYYSPDVGDIGHSLRFRSSASAYLSRTPASSTSLTTWTISCWLKRGELGTNQEIITAGNAVSDRTIIYLDTTNTINFTNTNSSVNTGDTTTAVIRDPSAWYHFVFVADTTNATAADRFQIWCNNQRIDVTSVVTSSGATTHICRAVAQKIGSISYSTGSYLDGYLARFCIVDGAALTPDSFGYLNTEINEWVSKTQSAVKTVVDAGGTNSFMLDFDDGSSTTTLGYDKSSKGNNWTCNNISLTAGTTYDWMLDVPGNSYAVLNPLDSSSGITNSEGNLKAICIVGSGGNSPSSIYMESGKWVCEAICNTANDAFAVGITRPQAVYCLSAGGVGYYYNGHIRVNGSTVTTVTALSAGSVIRMELDATSGSLEFFLNGVSKYTASSFGFSGPYAFTLSDASSTTALTGNISFGQAPLHSSAIYDSSSLGYFRDTPTAGFKALCQRNLSEGAVRNPTSAVAHRWESGSGIAPAISTDRTGWADWLEIFKRTDTTEDWKVRFSSDSSNMMAFNTNAAKAAWSAPSAGTYLGIALKLGATYGIVSGTYTGDNTSNRNITHAGLNAAPTCGLVKSESSGSWYFWHANMTGAAYWTNIDNASPPAQSNTNSPWGTGNWSSTQFMVTNNATNNLNASSTTYRYILFTDIAAFLAMMKFTGTGTTDGAYAYSGHRPQISIEKNLATASDFILFSDKVDTYNVTASYLKLNTTGGLTSATGVDLTALGIKHQSATIANAANAHGTITIAKTNGKYANAR